MYAVDLHAHTRPFHLPRGRPTVYDPFGAKTLAAVGRRRGLDGVAITNHDYRVRYESADPLFVDGIEVTTSDGHVLVIGPDPPRRSDPHSRTAAEVVEEAHDRGCAAVLAHPFRDSGVARTAALDADFDAVELNGKQPQRRDRVDELANELGLPTVGGSDTHLPFELGRAHTMVYADELTAERLVDAIRDGHVEPAVEHYASDKVILPVYDAIHRVRDEISALRQTRPL